MYFQETFLIDEARGWIKKADFGGYFFADEIKYVEFISGDNRR